MEDGRIEERVGAVVHGIRQAGVAGGVAAGAVDLLARARRERAGERLDPAAGDVDDGDRGHPHHRAFEQLRAERLVAVLGAAHGQRPADVVPAGVAGSGLLGERLQRRIDRDVDRVADVDRRAVEDDAVARGRRGARGARERIALALGVDAIERARRLAQRFERLQQR